MYKKTWIRRWMGMLSMPNRVTYLTIHVTLIAMSKITWKLWSKDPVYFLVNSCHFKICEVFSHYFFSILYESYTHLYIYYSNHYLFQYFFLPLSLHFHSGTPIMGILVWLMVSYRFLRFCSLFKKLNVYLLILG